MAQTKASEFYVRLEGIKLPKEAEERIADKVRATVMRELAALDLRKGSGSDGGKAPTKGGAGGISTLLQRKDWYGFVLLKGGLIDKVAQFNGSAINAGKVIQTNTFAQR